MNKYLKKLELDDGVRNFIPNEPQNQDGEHYISQWLGECAEYGFISKETWSMDVSLIFWIYERFSMYKEFNDVDLTYEDITINGETLCQKDWLDRIIWLSGDLCKNYIAWDENYQNKLQVLLDIVTKTIHAWWW